MLLRLAILALAACIATPALAAVEARADTTVVARSACPRQPPMLVERRCPKPPVMAVDPAGASVRFG